MTDIVGQMGSLPGWYADPYGRAVQRYFNGAAWTSYVIDATGMQTTEERSVPGAPPPPIANAGKGAIVIQNIVQAPQPYIPQYVAPMMVHPQAKSPGTAVLLAFLFGPLGLLYVNVGAAIGLTVLAIVTVPTIVIPFVIWIVSMVMASSQAKAHNMKLLAVQAAPQPIYGAYGPPPAGY